MKVLIVCASLALSGCATGARMSPEQTHQLLVDFYNAGCGGKVDIDAGAGTGQLGGEAHISLGLHGECPTHAPPPPVTPPPATPSA